VPPKGRADADTLARKDRVVAAVDMPGIPAGTTGRVIFVEGISWIRYWVRFDNGVVRGSINRKKVARPSEWADILRRRELGLDDVEGAGAVTTNGETSPGATAAAAGDGVVVNGVTVPALLIERTKNRLQALGVSR
jgi:hypothetical protein